MKKINRTKLVFAALPVIFIALLLFMRWNEYGRSYKSLANWGNELERYSETAYYSNRAKNIISKWQKACNNPDNINDSNSTFLHFDLEKNAIWLEDNGQVKNENYINLPEQTFWVLSYTSFSKTIELPKRIILRTMKIKQEFAGQFVLSTDTRYRPYCFIFNNKTNTSGSIFQNTLLPVSINSQPTIDYTSFIINEDDYNQYKDFLFETSSEQYIEKETSKQTAFKENKSKWLDIEKYLYMEIDGQVLNSGFELDSLELEAGPDYTGAYAIIRGSGESVIHKYLGLGASRKNVQSYFKIDYLGNDTWYAGTAPHPKRKLESDRKLNLEFLIFPEEQISRSQYRKYIKLGRRVQQSDDFLSSKWKASLPNGITIEIIGIKSDIEPDIWWGPDGSALEFPDYFQIEPINQYDNVTLVAWQIKLPEKKEGKQMFFDLKGVKDTRTVEARDKYGNVENVFISFFDNPLQKTDFRIGIKESDGVTRIANFNNISLIPGKEQGFEIEVEETGDK